MRKSVCLFSGQGSQYVGMGKNFFATYDVAKETFKEADEALGFELSRMCFEGSMEDLTQTENTQPAILTTSVAMFRVLRKEYAIEPEYLLGHSLGEITALTCAGAIKFSDAVRLVRKRGIFMKEATTLGSSAMAAIGNISVEKLKVECLKHNSLGQSVWISNFNSNSQNVISGNLDSVMKLGECLKEQGAKVTLLNVSAPFHCELMKEASYRFSEEIKNYQFSDLRWPVISNVTAQPYKNKDEIQEKLVQQIISPVQWHESTQYILKKNPTCIIELGPKSVLKNLITNETNAKVFAMDHKMDMEKFETYLEHFKREDYTAVVQKCITYAVCTPNKNWNDIEYKEGVIQSYRQIVSIDETLMNEGKSASREQALDAIRLLERLLDTKKVSKHNKLEIFKDIANETGISELFSDYANNVH